MYAGNTDLMPKNSVSLLLIPPRLVKIQIRIVRLSALSHAYQTKIFMMMRQKPAVLTMLMQYHTTHTHVTKKVLMIFIVFTRIFLKARANAYR